MFYTIGEGNLYNPARVSFLLISLTGGAIDYFESSLDAYCNVSVEGSGPE